MTKKGQKAGNSPARPIRTRQDHEGASAVVKHLSRQTDRNPITELRLQALLREMDRFDDQEDATSEDSLEESEYSGARRRWSDDTRDTD